MRCEHSGAEWVDNSKVDVAQLKSDIEAYRKSAALYREKYEAAHAENEMLMRRVISLEAQIQNNQLGGN